MGATHRRTTSRLTPLASPLHPEKCAKVHSTSQYSSTSKYKPIVLSATTATDLAETEETRVYAPEAIRREFEVYLQNLDRDLAIETQVASIPTQRSTNKENRDVLDVSAA